MFGRNTCGTQVNFFPFSCKFPSGFFQSRIILLRNPCRILAGNPGIKRGKDHLYDCKQSPLICRSGSFRQSLIFDILREQKLFDYCTNGKITCNSQVGLVKDYTNPFVPFWIRSIGVVTNYSLAKRASNK